MTKVNTQTVNTPDEDQFWIEHINAYKRSGLTIAQYCSEHSLSVPRFRYKLYRGVPFKGNKAPDTPAFVPVKITDPRPCLDQPLCILKFVKGHELRVYDQGTLTLLLERLN
jgi:hypothetical protein